MEIATFVMASGAFAAGLFSMHCYEKLLKLEKLLVQQLAQQLVLQGEQR